MEQYTKDDLMSVVAAQMSKVANRNFTLSNEHESHVNSYRLYWNGKPTETLIGYESAIFSTDEAITDMVNGIYLVEKIRYVNDWFSVL